MTFAKLILFKLKGNFSIRQFNRGVNSFTTVAEFLSGDYGAVSIT